MPLNTNIPMMGQPVNFLETYGRGKLMGQQVEANALAMDNTRTDQRMKAAQMLAQGVLNDPDPARAYGMALGQAERMGMDISAFPGEYGPDAEMAMRMVVAPSGEATTFMQNLAAAGIDPSSPKGREMLIAKYGMGPAKAPGGFEAAPGGGLRPIAGGPADPAYKAAVRPPPTPRAPPAGYRWKDGVPGEAEPIPGYTGPIGKGGGRYLHVDPETGELTLAEGDAVGEMHALGRRPEATVETGIMADTLINENLTRVGELAGIKPDGTLTPEGRAMFTYWGKLANWAAAIKDKADIDLTPEEKAALGRFTRFSQMSERLFNRYRKDITGAAAAVAELQMLRDAFVNKDLGPEQFLAAYDEYSRELKRSIRLKRRFLREGISLKDLREKDGDAGLDYDLRFGAGEDDDPTARYNELLEEYGGGVGGPITEENLAKIKAMMIAEGYE